MNSDLGLVPQRLRKGLKEMGEARRCAVLASSWDRLR